MALTSTLSSPIVDNVFQDETNKQKGLAFASPLSFSEGRRT